MRVDKADASSSTLLELNGSAQTASIMPRNLHMLVDFFEFVASCDYCLDPALSRLLERNLVIVFASEVKGFANSQRIREALLARVA